MSDLQWTNVRVRLGEIQPWEHNPRQSTKRTAAALLSTLDEFGQPVPFILMPKQGNKYPCIDGHQRLSAWVAKFGTSFEVDARLASRPLTDDERRKYVIKFHAAAVGEWDADALSLWDAGQIESWGVDNALIKGWEQDVKTFKELLASEAPTVDAEPQTDRAAELLEKWKVVTGDLFAIGEHRLICGDCTDAAVVARVMDGEKAGAVITDPPYDVGGGGKYSDAYKMDVGQAAEFQGFDEGFIPLPFLELTSQYIDNPNWFVFTSPYLSWKYYQPFFYDRYDVSTLFVWSKSFCLSNVRGVGFAKSYEIAVYAWNKGHYFEALPGVENYDVWKGTSNEGGKSDLHPTSKPLALINRIVRQLSPEKGIVYEPFSGSGTTLVACQNLSRRCRAVEISPAYVAVTLERMAVAFPNLEIRKVE